MNSRDDRRALNLLLISFYGFVMVGLPAGLLNVTWLAMQARFNLSLDALGVLLGAWMVGRLLVSFASGSIVARLGMGRFLMLGHTLYGVGVLGHALAPTWALLVVAGFITGLGMGVLVSGYNTYVAANYTAGRLNWLNACYGVGLAFGPLLLTLLTALHLPWQSGYLVALGTHLVGLLLVWRSLAAADWPLAPTTARATAAASFGETLRLPYVWITLLVVFAYGGLEVSGGQLTKSLFVAGRGMDELSANFWIGVYWAAYTVGRILIGFGADRVTPTTVLRACMLGALGGAALLWWSPTPTVGFLGLALLGFSIASYFPTLVSATTRCLGARHAVNTVGFQGGAAGLGGAVIPGIAGLLANSLGLEVIGPCLLAVALLVALAYEGSLRLRPQA